MKEEPVFHRHPYSGELYAAHDVNRVEVIREGKSGFFTRNGQWIEGELKSADPIYCRWVSSANIVKPRVEKFMGSK